MELAAPHSHLFILMNANISEQRNMCHEKTLGIVQVDESAWKALGAEEKLEIERFLMRS